MTYNGVPFFSNTNAIAESERKLDTLPEEKLVPTTPNPCTKNSNQTLTNNATTTTIPNSSNHNKDGYKRVYTDWKPSKTLDTDVVGTIEAIAGELAHNLCISATHL